jgi:Asparagine synthase
MPTVMFYLEAPFADPIAAVQYLLMREARALGVKVVLNGHGSDESLGGYHGRFVPAYLADLPLSFRLSLLREQRAFRKTGWLWLDVLRYVLRGLVPVRLRSRVAAHLLCSGSCAVAHYLNPPRFGAKLQAYSGGDGASLSARRIWRVLSTELWLRTLSDSRLTAAVRQAAT